ncbi:MAG: lamin tail domain-containing protein, partial [Phycisphaerae bacterium]|nr:lamin tail domain-containing protein [Phycisphaerae bacterium]
YVRTLLLEDLVGNNGVFLDNDNNDEAFDAPGGADPWLASHGETGITNWRYISNLVGGAAAHYEDVDPDVLEDDADTDEDGPEGADSDGDGIYDARWIPDDSALPFANVTAVDGTRYRVAIRIVDTNALANINVGQVYTNDPNAQKLWDGQYPADLNLRDLIAKDGGGAELDVAGVLDSNAAPAGRYNAGLSANYRIAASELYTNLYRYLAYPNPGPNIRPFDVAEDLALRMEIIPNTDLHGRLGTLWPATFGANSDLLTAYSWTMQIRPPTADPAVDTALTNLGYPAPCKVSLANLIDWTPVPPLPPLPDENRCRAVYLGLLAAGMTPDEAAQFLVNLVDYVDNDNENIEVIDPGDTRIVDFGALPAGLAPTNAPYYGTDNQPIISEVYVEWHYTHDGNPPDPISGNYTYILDAADLSSDHAYAVELYNPTDQAIDLDNWDLYINGTSYTLNSPPLIPAGGFLTLHGNLAVAVSSGNPFQLNNLVITPSQPIRLRRPWPSASSISTMVGVDRFDGTTIASPAPTVLSDEPPPTIVRTEYSERSGRYIPFGSGPPNPLEPVIATFRPSVSGTAPKVLGDYPTTDIGGGQGGQIVLRNGELHSLGELFYVARVANTASGVELIVAMEGQSDGDSDYRLDLNLGSTGREILQYLTLRTGLNDGADNDGDRHVDDNDNMDDGVTPASDESIANEARVPGLININTAPVEVIEALHYYYGSTTADQVRVGDWFKTVIRPGGGRFVSTGEFADLCSGAAGGFWQSKDEVLDSDGVTPLGSPDGITVDNEQKLFHFTNVANLISVRSDVFVVYITIQASDRDGDFDNSTATLRTMAIVDRSFCLQPYDDTGKVDMTTMPLPRIVAQTTLP